MVAVMQGQVGYSLESVIMGHVVRQSFDPIQRYHGVYDLS